MPRIKTASQSDAAADHKDFRHYQQAGVPFIGQPPLMLESEYDDRTVRVGAAIGFGLFDLNNPDDVHFGRTLDQVLNRCYNNEYELLDYKDYNNGIVTGPGDPPGVFLFVSWAEKADTTHEHAKKLSEQIGRTKRSSTDVGRR